jgi:hypothetical protein
MLSSVNTADISRLSMPPDSAADEERDELSPNGIYRQSTDTELKTADQARKVFSIDPASESYYDPSDFGEISENQCKEILKKFDRSLILFEISDECLKYIVKKPNNFLAICEKIFAFFKDGVLPQDSENSWTRKAIIEQIFVENSNLVEESADFLEIDFLKKNLSPNQNTRLHTLLRAKSKHLSKIRAMVLRLCEDSTEGMSPGSRCEGCYTILRDSADWVQLLMTASRTKPGCFYYNLEHICDGDARGGMHIIKTGTTITKELAKNDQTNVLYAEIDLGEKGSKSSTFFPLTINTKTKLVELLSESTFIGSKKSTNHRLHVVSKDILGSDVREDLYINIYMGKDLIRVNTAFPVFQMFNYIKEDQVNTFSLTIGGKSHSLTIEDGRFPPACAPFCQTDGFEYYDASGAFDGVSVFLKVPL